MTKIAGGATIVALLMSLAWPAAAQTQQKKIHCWTDAQGHRACGDRMPPEYASQERKTIDAQGRIVETIRRERTPEELAAEQKAAAEAAAAKLQMERQAGYDRFLVDSYSSVKDLERARNERLATLDGRANLARQSIASSEESRSVLQVRVDSQLKKGRSPEMAQKQLREVEKILRDNRAAIDQMQKDRERVCMDFHRDITRYQELTMGEAAYAGKCPEPGSPELALAVKAKVSLGGPQTPKK